MKRKKFCQIRKTLEGTGLLLPLIILWLTMPECTAQNAMEESTEIPKHEIGFSVGFFPILDEWDPARGHSRFAYHDQFRINKRDSIDSWLIGAFTFNYNYNITHYHAVGVLTTLAFRHATIIPTGQSSSTSLNAVWALQASYRITFKRYAVCSLYAGCSMGFTLYILDKQWQDALFVPHILPSGHITVLGISLGKRNNANIELGYGTQGSFRVGYSAKF